MFERYTEKARRVIFFARYEARQFGSPYIETKPYCLRFSARTLRLRLSKTIPIMFGVLCFTLPLSANSYYLGRPDDPKAAYLTPDNFPVKGDGLSDDSEGIQRAIDTVQETHNQGIVFVPAGRYRLTKTVYIWPGIRLIGYGAERPTFVLAANTPGFQTGPTYMFFFAGGRPKGNTAPPDANPGTFYSAISNIDIEIQDGNPGAVGVRAHYAQHCFLAHMDFRIGSGLAGVHDGGNVAHDVHFYGGQYGIWTRKPSPGWQFTIVDATFEGQREAAIREHEAGLTLIRPQFRNVPTAISIDPTYADELWIKDGRMENIDGPAIVISNENNARTEINAENIVCRKVPIFAQYRESGKQVAGNSEVYDVTTFSHGLHFADIGSEPAIQDVYQTTALKELPPQVKSDIPDLPEVSSWANIRDLGAHGDGSTDDTEAIRNAIAGHRTIYFPSGQYLVSDTITLKPDTVLVGLHPSVTRIFLADSTPAFQGVGNPKSLIEAPQGGTNIVTGIGLYTNGINPRAVGAKWMAGRDSMMNDVRFLGGHGTIDLDVSADEARKIWQKIYNNNHTADSDLNRRWDAQYPSLWITNGGGGTFLDIWTPSTFAQAGLYISNTSTEGRIYELSSEHHVRNEVVMRNVSNWKIYALQTEEERGEGGFALPLEIQDSHDVTVANMHIYRVVSSYQPFPYAITISNSRNIAFRNIHCYSDSKVSFDNTIYDQTHDFQVREREFAWLTVSGNSIQSNRKYDSQFGKRIPERIAGGFFNISGGAVDHLGNFYFVDAKWQTIYRWSAADNSIAKVRDNPLDPVNLIFDKSGNLIVVSSGGVGPGVVYSFKPDSPDDGITVLKPETSEPRPQMTPVLPVNYVKNGHDFLSAITAVKPYHYISPDRTTYIPAGQDFVSGQLYYGAKMQDIIRAFGLAAARPGEKVYISDESEHKTYSATVGFDGTLSDLKLFVERGGEGLTVDQQGNVYIAAGQIFIYNPSGKQIGEIQVPERPIQLAFAGKDGKTLMIAARTSLYRIHLPNNH